MSATFGQLARALLLAAGIAIAIALPGLVGTSLIPSDGDPGARVAMAAPASDNDGNDDPTNDNCGERNIEDVELLPDTRRHLRRAIDPGDKRRRQQRDEGTHRGR